mgnify:CR=1 FL=1
MLPPALLVIQGFIIRLKMNYRNDSIFETLLGKVIHEKVSGIELRGGMIWMVLFILQQLY